MCIDPKEAMAWWSADPLAIGIVVTTSSIYLRGARALWRTAGRGRGLRAREIGFFAAGQLTLLLALVSPIDRLSDLLFSAHMTQHELIMLVAPALIVLGRPWIALLWALPAPLRSRVRVLIPAWRIIGSPWVAVSLHAVVVWIWHIPELFEAALRSEVVHAVQHVTFFASAALFWWAVVHGRQGRLGYGLVAAFVIATAMHTSVLGALMTVAQSLWYPSYRARGAPFAVDAAGDQALAGLVMWIPGGLVLGLVALGLLAVWLGEAGRRVRLAERRRTS